MTEPEDVRRMCGTITDLGNGWSMTLPQTTDTRPFHGQLNVFTPDGVQVMSEYFEIENDRPATKSRHWPAFARGAIVFVVAAAALGALAVALGWW